MIDDRGETTLEGHGGDLAIACARAHGIETMFTLSGAHIFPLYDAARRGPENQASPALHLIDVRHEQTAVFAAEAMGKLTRTPSLAAVTAGPGVTNGISAITQAYWSGSPLVLLAGRAPQGRWGSGSLQELDHPPMVEQVTKLARTVPEVEQLPARLDEAFLLAGAPHRGPVFVDVAMDQLYRRTTVQAPVPQAVPTTEPDRDALTDIAEQLSVADRPVVVLGGDVWLDGAEEAARALVEEIGAPVITNGMGRGLLPAGHSLLASKARSTVFGECDLAVVVGTPLDFRLGYGSFGGRNGTPTARVVHVVDHPDQLATHVDLDGAAAGSLATACTGLLDAWRQVLRHPDWSAWTERVGAAAADRTEQDRQALCATSAPIHPGRVYGELIRQLADDAVVIGDGGDFVSYAGKYVEPTHPGCWLDPGPFGCLGAGLGAAIAARIARPSSQVVLLLGDGAAGMSLLDVDTLVRHQLPVVIIVGNNGAWGLEKHPMRMLYGYDVAADLRQSTAYDEVVRALGGAGETVRRPDELAPALRRGFDAEAPYLLNVLIDPDNAYPRATFGV